MLWICAPQLSRPQAGACPLNLTEKLPGLGTWRGAAWRVGRLLESLDSLDELGGLALAERHCGPLNLHTRPSFAPSTKALSQGVRWE
jgi:hypothetical protein